MKANSWPEQVGGMDGANRQPIGRRRKW